MGRPRNAITQAFADELVRAHPNATSGELLNMVAPNRRDDLAKYLRWPPDMPRPAQNVPKQRVRTPLTIDLERRLAEGVKNPRPRRRVDVGSPTSDPSEKD
jgi:hypothetical protein